MASENNKDNRLIMSEGLKKLTKEMVSEGVTPKSGMKKVKAMKRLWRSDSFQMMKSILEEPPIQEGRARPHSIPLKEDDDDDDELAETEASPRDTALEKENKEREFEFLKKKEELRGVYQNCLEEDLANLQSNSDKMMNELLEKARLEVEASEGGKLEETVKHKIKDMLNYVKCFKKNRNKTLKMALEEDRKLVTAELKSYLEREMETRAKTYKQLLEKVYNYKLQFLEESVTDDYQDKLRQRIRVSINKFECAKERLLKRHKKDLEDLNCRLGAEFAEHVKWSGNRMNSLLDDAVREINETKESEEIKPEETKCSVVARMQSKLRLEGWLPWEPSEDEDWQGLIQELMDVFQIFIELVLKDRKTKQNEYLLSMEKLKLFKDKISKINQKKLMDTEEIRIKRKTKVKGKLRAASLIDYLIRQVLPSPLPSRYSFSDLFNASKLYGSCPKLPLDKHPTLMHDDPIRKSILAEMAKKESKPVHKQSHGVLTVNVTSSSGDTNALVKQIKSRGKDVDTREQSQREPEPRSTGLITDQDRENYVNILHENPQLYNIFFFNL